MRRFEPFVRSPLIAFLMVSLGTHGGIAWTLHKRAKSVEALAVVAEPEVQEQGDEQPIGDNVTPSFSMDGPQAQPQAIAEPAQPVSQVARPSRRGASNGAGATGQGERTTVGAVGDRAATDLSFSFTHFLTQVTSADPSWAKARVGEVLRAEVVLGLSDDGVATLLSVSPGEGLLARGVHRTMTVFEHRRFTAGGHHITIRLGARVSKDAVHDDVRGTDVFAIGKKYEQERHTGRGFFSLAVGVRVDFDVLSIER